MSATPFMRAIGVQPMKTRRSDALIVRFFALAAVLVLPVGCGDAGKGVDCASPAADCTLRQAAEQAGVKIGAAARTGFADDPEYGAALAHDFDSTTAENAMKWAALEPRRGEFRFAEGDRLVEFAEANQMAIRGHNLIWDQQVVDSTPDYVTEITDPVELRQVMADHIRTVVGHYRGRVDSWDVVNEPLETAGPALYGNVFLRLLGPGYIAEALDAVGIQGHFFAQPRREELQANLQSLADLGVIVELTEVDVPLRAGGTKDDQLEEQRQEYHEIASACLAVAACQRITLWGFTDRFTWIDSFVGPGHGPLVLDEQYQRKPAYFGLRDALVEASAP